MRSLLAFALALVVVVALSACVTNDDETKDGCDGHPELCPVSSKTATRVVCNCTCELPNIPAPGASNVRFQGKLAACLPSPLNPWLASAEEKRALQDMSPAQFNQEVFQFCSGEIADWLSLTVKSQVARIAQVPAGLGCEPYRCRCATDGANSSYTPCEKPCEERSCDARTCMPLLRQDGNVDSDGCLCGRTEACGFIAPARDKPPLCRTIYFEKYDQQVLGNDNAQGGNH
jgi:hypothetical protein